MIGYLSIDRIATAAGQVEAAPGGAALYAALGARAAGAAVSLVACAGDDWPQNWTSALSAQGIDVAAMVRRAGPTRRARLDYASDGQRRSAHHDEAAWWECTDRLAPPDPPRTDAADVIVAGPMRAVRLRRLLDRAPGARVVADTSEAFARSEAAALCALLSALSVFMPSREETRLLAPGPEPARVLAACGAVVVEKRGAEGLAVYPDADAQPLVVAAPEVVVIDPTGAGDATVGAFAAGLARGESVLAAARGAVAVGARCVTGPGPSALGLAWGPVLP